MTTRRSTLWVVPALGLTTLWGGALSAHAVTLEQKWQKGATYNYDFNMQGDATILTDAPQFPLAGMPLPIKLKGAGQVSLFTSDVNADGAGSVVPSLAPFTLNAEAFGQKLEAQFAKDKTQVLFGGRPAWAGGALPPTTFQISREGKLLGVVLPDIQLPTPGQGGGPGMRGPRRARPDGANGANGGGMAMPAPAPEPGGVAKPAGPNPMAAMIQNIITQTFPAIWPGHDVNEGDTWSATVTPPTVNVKPGEMPTVTAPAADAKPLGKFDFKLGPEEKIGDRTARRISMTGTLVYTAEAPAAGAAKPAVAAPGAPGMPQGQLQSVNQKVSGSLWFDPTLGQIVRAELDMQSGIRGTMTVAMGPGGGNPSNGSLDFTGTIQMQLKNVTPPAADATVAAPAAG